MGDKYTMAARRVPRTHRGSDCVCEAGSSSEHWSTNLELIWPRPAGEQALQSTASCDWSLGKSGAGLVCVRYVHRLKLRSAFEDVVSKMCHRKYETPATTNVRARPSQKPQPLPVSAGGTCLDGRRTRPLPRPLFSPHPPTETNSFPRRAPSVPASCTDEDGARAGRGWRVAAVQL